MELEKDETIQQVVLELQNALGEGSFVVADHWEADLMAIGIARPDNYGVLVYISTEGPLENRYFVSLELPSVNDVLPYQQGENFESIDFIALVDVVKQHFSI